jgi:hypothetical protein
MDCIVVGAGGNGQTYFMKFLIKNKININNLRDIDKLKHMPKPKPKKKYIFIYNDPFKSILSHYRRNYSIYQIYKLGNPYKLRFSKMRNFYNFQKITIENNKDVFGIKNQFDNFINYKGDIIFIDFNEILDKKEIIDKFLNKKLNYSFFKIKERNEYKFKIDPEFKNIYEKLYEYIKLKVKEINI